MRLAPDRTILILAAVFSFAAVALLWHQAYTHSRLVESTAVRDAARYSDAMREFRTLYTSEVVNPLSQHGIIASHDYKERDGSIPLPATLSMMLGNAIAESGSGGTMRLYSPYPFPWRLEEGGLGDDFQRDAWAALTRNPEEPWFRFSELDGLPVLRYATADVMRESCVACHNTHLDSPKADWEVGDVRGVLEVVVPLDATMAQAQEDRRESIAVVSAFVGLGLFAVVLVTRRLRRTSLELERRVTDRTSELEESRRSVESAMGDLQASEEKFRGIYETMADGFVRARLADGKIFDANPAAARILGYPSVEALMERPTADLYANPADRAQVLERMAQSGEFQGLEIEMLRWDGSHVPLVLNGRVLRNESGEPESIETNFFDISTQKEAEKALEHAREAAEQANRAKSAFLANMSHELRTPMNAIIGYSEILMEDAEDEGNADAIADLKKIHSAGKHLLGLINDVLDLSKVEAGKMDVFVESFEIPAMLDEVVATIDTLMQKNGNQLRVELEPGLASMRADLTKVRQALFNLLSNAAKFTHEGEITLTVSSEEVDGVPWVRMAVTDSGIGIAPDKIDLVFEEFSQAESSTTRNYGGTGLGLPLSRRFCQLMGGDLGVESEVGRGSTFTIRLPREVTSAAPERVEEGAAGPVAVTPEPGVEPTVLVVDDDPNALDLLARTLQGAGLRVVTASDGREALRLAKTLHPLAITLDVQMPQMDGWEVLSRLKGEPETRDIPVIMVTMTDDRELGYALGATDFLTKPVDRSQLVQVLSRHSQEGAEKHALVVDDKQANRDVLRHALERESWRVSEAENGQVALERLSESRPSLILLDLMMPVMDGFEFVMALRKREDARGIPIVVVTAKDVTDEERQRLNGDVVGLIRKSGLGQDALLAQLREQVAAAGGRAD
jgi:PAS domain S-box-containing protein